MLENILRSDRELADNPCYSGNNILNLMLFKYTSNLEKNTFHFLSENKNNLRIN